MMKKIKQLMMSIILAVMTLGLGTAGFSQNAQADSAIDASAAMVVDAKTGQVIYQQNGDQKLPIASITKLLTVSVIINEINHHKLSWNSKVKISKAVEKISKNSEFSNVELDHTQTYTVRQLVNATLIKSADGAAFALSTTNGDTVASFNKKMKAEAAKMGVKDADIYNATGLSNGDLGKLRLKNVSKKAENKMSATDLAKMSQYIIKNYPEVLTITKTKSADFKTNDTTTTKMDNLNEMLPGGTTAPTKVTMDGLKTGSSDAAGKSFVGTGTYQNNRFITVVLHANGSGDSDTRFSETVQLLEKVYTDYNQVTIKKGDQLNGIDTISVPAGKATTVALRAAQDTTVWLPKNVQLSDLKHAVVLKSSFKDANDALQAPVKAGQTVGEAQLTGNGVDSLTGAHIDVNLAAQSNVQEANLFVRAFRKLASFFTGGVMVHVWTPIAQLVQAGSNH